MQGANLPDGVPISPILDILSSAALELVTYDHCISVQSRFCSCAVLWLEAAFYPISPQIYTIMRKRSTPSIGI